MIYDFHKLKVVSVANGEVTLRIPERWGVWPDEGRPGFWACYEKGDDGTEPDTGTLWIHVDHFIWEDDGSPSPQDMGMKHVAESAAREKAASGSPLLESSVLQVEDGYRWCCVYDTEEGGEGLRFWFSHFYLNQGGHMAVIAMNLVLTHAQMDDPEFTELREIMEREIGAAFLDPFRGDDEERVESILGPLRRCNFSDWVKLTLLEAMSINIDEKTAAASPRWYCRLQTDDSHAGMFVECRTLEMKDENGSPVLLPAAMHQAVLDDITGEGRHDHYVPMPDGMIAYDVYDDTAGVGELDEEERPFQGFRNHVWRYARFAEGTAQLLVVLLMLPLPEYGRRPYAALSAYMQRAVRRAEFPGFAEVERH